MATWSSTSSPNTAHGVSSRGPATTPTCTNSKLRDAMSVWSAERLERRSRSWSPRSCSHRLRAPAQHHIIGTDWLSPPTTLLRADRDFVLIERALRDEGTSYHYLP